MKIFSPFEYWFVIYRGNWIVFMGSELSLFDNKTIWGNSADEITDEAAKSCRSEMEISRDFPKLSPFIDVKCGVAITFNFHRKTLRKQASKDSDFSLFI